LTGELVSRTSLVEVSTDRELEANGKLRSGDVVRD
jgi:hypothetical protein